jgi:hypothetical protein
VSIRVSRLADRIHPESAPRSWRVLMARNPFEERASICRSLGDQVDLDLELQ